MQPSDCQFMELEAVKLPLVNQFYKRVYKKGVARNNERVFILKKQTIICSAKLKTLDKQLLLSGVACAPEFRGQGYASQLLKSLLLLQTQAVYCFPYPHLQPLYSQLGFAPADAASVPQIIRQKFAAYSKNRALLLMVYFSKSGSQS